MQVNCINYKVAGIFMSVHITGLKRQFVAPDGSAVPVIDVETLELADNQQVALTGTSGLGKTTLLHLLSGILTPDHGSIVYQLNGQRTDIARLPESARDVFRGRHIGYVFQTHHLLPAFTALENVLLGMSFGGKHDRAWATHLLERVGLGQRLGFKPAKLSVGQQQRVAVARAMANRPAVVYADEPTGALDSASAQIVLALIRDLCTEVQATLLLVTHDRAVAAQFPKSLDLAAVNRARTMAAAPAAGVAAR
jgi:putative ABC transport system ATP-binding protein